MATVESQIAQWRQDLLELTNRNPLLSMSRSATPTSTIQLVEPSAEVLFDLLTRSERPLIILGTEPPTPDSLATTSHPTSTDSLPMALPLNRTSRH